MPKILTSLQFQLICSILLGVACGIFFGEYCSVLDPIGRAFIMLLKMSVLPLMSASLIHALGKLKGSDAAWLLRRSLLALLTVWGLTLIVIFSVAVIFPERTEGSFFSQLSEGESYTEGLLELFIPANPIHALANDIVPAVVFFSLLFGLALMGRQNKKPLLDTLHLIVRVLIRITDWITRLSPIGVFALIANTMGTMPLDEFSKIQLYFIAYVGGILLLVFLLFPLLIQSVTPVTARRFLSEVRPAMLLAFTTGNTLISLPHIMKALENIVEEVRTNKSRAHNAIESVVPIAYNFPTVGNLFALLFVLFLSFFYALPFGIGQLFKMVVVGIPVLFGSGNSVINAVGFLIDQLRLPVDGLALFLETMPLTRNFQMLGTSTGIATVGILTCLAAWPRRPQRWLRIGRNGLIALAIIITTIVTIRWMNLTPPQEVEVFSTLTLEESVNSSIITKEGRSPRPGADTLDRIRQSGVLRVGFNPNVKPFSYFNQSNELVGFDVALAHNLAQTLGVTLEFIPMQYERVVEELIAGKYDIAMSALSISPDRMLEISYTASYLEAQHILVVEDYRRSEFSNYEQLKRRSDITICTLPGALVEVARSLFPAANLEVLDTAEEFFRSEAGDALLWTQPEGTTWTLTHPRYMTITTDTDLGKEYYGFAVAPYSERLLQYLELWLDIRKQDGKVEGLYDRWVKGDIPDDEPRWSVIRNVLHWVD